jgi:membrane fusion protein (multidrug efflux system)
MKKIYRIKLIAISGILLISLISGGCNRQQKSQSPPSIAEVSVVTVQPQKVILNTELPGRTSA